MGEDGILVSCGDLNFGGGWNFGNFWDLNFVGCNFWGFDFCG